MIKIVQKCNRHSLCRKSSALVSKCNVFSLQQTVMILTLNRLLLPAAAPSWGCGQMQLETHHGPYARVLPLLLIRDQQEITPPAKVDVPCCSEYPVLFFVLFAAVIWTTDNSSHYPCHTTSVSLPLQLTIPDPLHYSETTTKDFFHDNV